MTQCQVCIEQNECRILGKCDTCLKAAHDQKMMASRSQNGTVDAGGVAMQRDGLMAEMTSLRLEALNRLRDLRTARQGVLTAQREAEWASEERHTSAHHLEEAREGLKDSRREISRWKLENEKKLKAKRVKARQQRLERQRAERKLADARREFSKAQDELREASFNTDEADSGDTNSSNVTAEDIWELQREAREKQQAVEAAERDLDNASRETEYLDRGLQQRVKGAQSGARKKKRGVVGVTSP